MRPDGISREISQLMGNSMNSLAPVLEDISVGSGIPFRDRPQFNKRATCWVLRSFSNSVRKDKLHLKHWVKSSEPEDGLGTKVDIINFTEEEYRSCLEDNDWSIEETQYLLDLCSEFDLRFVVVADRYNYHSQQRSIEDIKERYYTVTRKIMFARNPLADPTKKAEMSLLAYDKEKDIERKAFIERLYQRSLEELREEEVLTIEARRIDNQRKRIEKDRENLLKLLKSDLFGHPTLSQILSGESSQSTVFDARKKSKKKSIDYAVSDSESTRATLSIPSSALKKEKKVSGVFVRSQTITTIKSQTMLQKVKLVLEELGIDLVPKMPTEEICDHYDALIQSIQSLLEMKRQMDKLEHELRILQNRKALLLEKSDTLPNDTADTPGEEAPSSSKKRSISPMSKENPKIIRKS